MTTWRDKAASLTVGYFDSRIDEAEGEEEAYLFNEVNQDWAYAEFATEIYGSIIRLIADEGLTVEEALDKIANDKEYLDETFRGACSCAEGL